MKLLAAVASIVLAAVPAAASASAFLIDFERNWPYGTDVDGYYSGGLASDGTSGPNLGVSFVNVSGLSNDRDFTYYAGAPSPLGTAYAHTFSPGDFAYLNVASGVINGLSFFYSSPIAITGAIRAYSGLNGTGTLLGVFDLAASTVSDYSAFSQTIFRFNGIAESFDLTASANNVLFDNIASIPEPGAMLLLLVGSGAMLGLRRRNRGNGERDRASCASSLVSGV